MADKSTIVNIGSERVDLANERIYKVLMELAVQDGYASLAGRLESLTIELGCYPGLSADAGVTKHALGAALVSKCQGRHIQLVGVIMSTLKAKGKTTTLYILAACIVKLRELAGIRYYTTPALIDRARDASLCYDVLCHLVVQCSVRRDKINAHLRSLNDDITTTYNTEQSLLISWDVRVDPVLELITLVSRYMAMQHYPSVNRAIRLCWDTNVPMYDKTKTPPVASPTLVHTAPQAKATPPAPAPPAAPQPPAPTATPKTMVQIDGKPLDLTTVPVYNALLATFDHDYHRRVEVMGTLERLILALGGIRDHMVAVDLHVMRTMLERKCEGHTTVAREVIKMVEMRGKRMSLYILAACLVQLRDMGAPEHMVPDELFHTENGLVEHYDMIYHLADKCQRHQGSDHGRVRQCLQDLFNRVWVRSDEGQSFYDEWDCDAPPHEQLLTLVVHYLAMNSPQATQLALLWCRGKLVAPAPVAPAPVTPIPVVQPDPQPTTQVDPNLTSVLQSLVTVLAGMGGSMTRIESAGSPMEGMLAKAIARLSKRLTKLEEEVKVLAGKPTHDEADAIRLAETVSKLGSRLERVEEVIDDMEDAPIGAVSGARLPLSYVRYHI